MKAIVDHADDLDSNCYAAPLDAEGPTDETCKNDATTWVIVAGKPYRRYVCADHAAEVDRFGATDDPHPSVRACKRCQSLTPVDHITHDGVCAECTV